jgi:hypothetical protein
VRALLALELAKLRGSSRSLFFLLLPNLYALCYQVVLGIALVRGAQTLTALLGAGLTSFVIVHAAFGVLVYPLCMLLLTTELWCAELADRSLRTLLLTQVPRGRLLAGRVIVTAGVMVLAFAIFFAIFFFDAVLLSYWLPPDLWQKLKFDVVTASARMLVYGGVFALGMVTLSAFFTTLSIIASRTATVAMLAVVVVAALAFGLPSVVQYYAPDATWHEQVFVHPYRELFSKDLMKLLILEPEGGMGKLARIALALIANSAALFGLGYALLVRKQFPD